MPKVDRECVTHFHACDCREAEFDAWQAQCEVSAAVIHRLGSEKALHMALLQKAHTYMRASSPPERFEKWMTEVGNEIERVLG